MKLKLEILLFVLIVTIPQLLQAQSATFGVGATGPFGRNRWYTVDFRFAGIHSVAFEVETGYWSRHMDDSCTPTDLCFHTHFFERDWNAGVNTLYLLSAGRIGLSFGAGTGAHFLKREFSVFSPLTHDTRTDRQTSVEPDLHLVAALEFRFNNHVALLVGQRTEFIRHSLDEWKAYGGIRFYM